MNLQYSQFRSSTRQVLLARLRQLRIRSFTHRQHDHPSVSCQRVLGSNNGIVYFYDVRSINGNLEGSGSNSSVLRKCLNVKTPIKNEAKSKIR
jgi:hypothetical protein